MSKDQQHSGMRSLRALFSVALAMLSPMAFAHTVWLEPVADRPGEYRVAFGGHEGKEQAYVVDKLKTVDAYDTAGKLVALQRSDHADGVHLQVAPGVAMVALYFDNGIHTSVPGQRSVSKPLNEVPGGTRATHAVKHHKTVLLWSDAVTKPIGQPFEALPLEAAKPVAGQPFRFRVLLDGKPAEGVDVGAGENTRLATTDADGVAAFVPQSGLNRIWVGKRIPVTGNPALTELSYEYLFGFELP